MSLSTHETLSSIAEQITHEILPFGSASDKDAFRQAFYNSTRNNLADFITGKISLETAIQYIIDEVVDAFKVKDEHEDAFIDAVTKSAQNHLPRFFENANGIFKQFL